MKYWVYKDSRILGPFEKEAFAGLPGVTGSTLVCEGEFASAAESDWRPAGEVPDLATVTPYHDVAWPAAAATFSLLDQLQIGASGLIADGDFADISEGGTSRPRGEKPPAPSRGPLPPSEAIDSSRTQGRLSDLTAHIDLLQQRIAEMEIRQESLLRNLAAVQAGLRTREAPPSPPLPAEPAAAPAPPPVVPVPPVALAPFPPTPSAPPVPVAPAFPVTAPPAAPGSLPPIPPLSPTWAGIIFTSKAFKVVPTVKTLRVIDEPKPVPPAPPTLPVESAPEPVPPSPPLVESADAPDLPLTPTVASVQGTPALSAPIIEGADDASPSGPPPVVQETPTTAPVFDLPAAEKPSTTPIPQAPETLTFIGKETLEKEGLELAAAQREVPERLAKTASPSQTPVPRPRGNKTFILVAIMLVIVMAGVGLIFLRHPKDLKQMAELDDGRAGVGAEPAEDATRSPITPPPSIPAAPPSEPAPPAAEAPQAASQSKLDAAVALVKSFPLDGDRKTVGQWLEYSYSATPDAGKESWSASQTADQSYLVEYRFTPTTPGSAEAHYLFEADMARGIVSGKNAEATQMLAGETPRSASQAKTDAAIAAVKNFPLDGGRGTVARWLRTLVGRRAGKASWRARRLTDKSYLVDYRFTPTKRRAGRIHDVFEVDVDSGLVIAKNAAARRIMAGGPKSRATRRALRRIPGRYSAKRAAGTGHASTVPLLPLPSDSELRPPSTGGDAGSGAAR